MKTKHYLLLTFLLYQYITFGQGIPDVMENDSLSPIGFVTNSGQIISTDTQSMPSIFYHSIHTQPASYYFNDKMSFVYTRFSKDSGDTIITQTIRRLDVGWVGEMANHPNPTAFQETSEKVNYYYPHCKNDCDSLTKYKGLLYENIYPSVDLRIYSNQASVKFYFVIKPGADPDNISLHFLGQDVQIISPTLLCLTMGSDTFLLTPPITYEYDSLGVATQLSWSPTFISSGEYVDLSSNSNTFTLGSTLVYEFQTPITDYQGTNDTKNLEWSTLMGGDIWSQFWDIDTDNEGSVYVNGYTTSSNFPVSHSLIYTSASQSKPTQFNLATSDLIVVKFDQNTRLVWSTRFGGYDEEGFIWYGISTDNANNVYISANTFSSDLPLLPFNSLEPWPEGNNDDGYGYYDKSTYRHNADQVIVKFDQTTGVRKWATLFGGSGFSDRRWFPSDIVVDKSDNSFYICGVDMNIFVTDDAGPHIYDDFNFTPEPYLAKFNSDFLCTWSTYFSNRYVFEPDDGTIIHNLAIDENQRLIAVGVASGDDTYLYGDPTFVTAHSGTQYYQTFADDANDPESGAGVTNFNNFITRFNTDLSIDWSTYVGGSNSQMNFYLNKNRTSVHVANNGKIFLVANTRSTQDSHVPFPLVPPINNNAYFKDSYVDPYYANNPDNASWYGDGVVVQFNSSAEMEYSSYLGGKDGDWPACVTTDNVGNVYVTGSTASGCQTNGTGFFPTPTDPFVDYYVDPWATATNIKTYGVGYWDGFIVGFNPEMLHKWTNIVGGSDHDYISSSVCYEDYLYVVGSTVWTKDFTRKKANSNVSGSYYSTGSYKIFGQHTNPIQENFGFEGFIQRYKLTSFPMGLNEQVKVPRNEIIAYPNPASDNLLVRLKEGKLSSIYLYDSMGKCVKKQQVVGQKEVLINITSLPKGLYFVNAISNNNITHTTKVIVE